jgi:NAD(P)-dependent dehydrogenase (short-subunit alcohol dehydrogenase family)
MATRRQQRVLVTGANRGIGLEFVRQLAARGDRVFATARDVTRATELNDLATRHGDDRVTVVPLDVDDAEAIRAAADAVAAQVDALDLLINNAGVYAARVTSGGDPAERLGDFNFDDALAVLRTNAVSPLLVTEAMLPLLKKGDAPKVVSLSSGYGSVADNTGFPYYYGASKAAMNMFMRSLAGDAAAKGIVTIAMSPGWVKTDMGGPAAPMTADKAVAGMLKVIDALTPADNSRFLDWRGKEVAW